MLEEKTIRIREIYEAQTNGPEFAEYMRPANPIAYQTDSDQKDCVSCGLPENVEALYDGLCADCEYNESAELEERGLDYDDY